MFIIKDFGHGLVSHNLQSNTYKIRTTHFLSFPRAWSFNSFLPSWWPLSSISQFVHSFRHFVLFSFPPYLQLSAYRRSVPAAWLFFMSSITSSLYQIQLMDLSSSPDGNISDLYTHTLYTHRHNEINGRNLRAWYAALSVSQWKRTSEYGMTFEVQKWLQGGSTKIRTNLSASIVLSLNHEKKGPTATSQCNWA
jgi:hypothetical protein